MSDYLLDTNHASVLLDGDEPITSRVASSQNTADGFGISMTVLGELYFEAYASQRRDANLSRLANFVAQVIIREYDQAAAEEFGRIQAEQKRKGRPIPPTDAQIAAVARQQNLIVLTDDRHFSFVDNLQVENWIR
ncbi:PIN domain-containing protein [Candidatus Poribacteria bacterium]|nr:PIN domain-containing protein [Candidatus Poribacteria bacterium]